MSLVAGSYERFIWGFKLKHPKPVSETLTLSLSQQFSYAAHLAPITSLVISSTIAASCASDDTIKLYDLSTSTELGSTLIPSSSATCLSFYSSTNLIAGSSTGSVLIYDIDPVFALLKSVIVHKKSVNDLAVHKSGRIVLSVARDSKLGMVNLVRGKRSFITKLEKEASIVKYFCGSEKFFMCSGDSVSVHDSEDSSLCGGFLAPKRVLCAVPAENGLIFTGGEDRGITAWDSAAGEVAYNIKDAHKTRVKGIVVLSKNASAENPFLVASASSDGVIRVWDVRAVRSTTEGEPVSLSEANTKSRLTCLAGSSVKALRKPQMKKDAPENVEEMEDS